MSTPTSSKTVDAIKAMSKRRLVIASFISIIVVTLFLLIAPAVGFVSVELLNAYTPLLGFFFVGMFGVVAAYFGVERFVNRK